MTARRSALRFDRTAEGGDYEHLLDFENVSLSFKGLKALDDVTFHVDAGEASVESTSYFVVVSENGGGTSGEEP